jgi:hypothetical protein
MELMMGIADSVSESISGKAFGIHRTIDQLGAIAGPLVAFAILLTMDIQAVFLLSLIPGAITLEFLKLFKERSFQNMYQQN